MLCSGGSCHPRSHERCLEGAVLQWVSGELCGEGSSSVLHSSALAGAAAFQCLVPPGGHVCVRISPIPEERVAPHAWIVA